MEDIVIAAPPAIRVCEAITYVSPVGSTGSGKEVGAPLMSRIELEMGMLYVSESIITAGEPGAIVCIPITTGTGGVIEGEMLDVGFCGSAGSSMLGGSKLVACVACEGCGC